MSLDNIKATLCASCHGGLRNQAIFQDGHYFCSIPCATQATDVAKNPVREFSSGATRDTNDGKLVYTGFLSPIVLRRFAQYMHKNRFQSDGRVRSADNWKKGIPIDAYMESLGRHFMDVWLSHDGFQIAADPDEALCGVIFNAMGMLHERLKERGEHA